MELSYSNVSGEALSGVKSEIGDFLALNGLELDEIIEVFVLVRNSDNRLVACAGLDHATIKCVAIAPHYRGESLSLSLGSRIVSLAASRGVFHLFLYTTPKNMILFRGWGFTPLVEVPDLAVFMENSATALRRYCLKLAKTRQPGNRIGSVVMNANPFTLGHKKLIEQAASQCDWLHVFLVGEEGSLFSPEERYRLVVEGLADEVAAAKKGIKHVTIHKGSPYIVSHATFPGYFLKDKALVERGWATIDLLLFRNKIAPALGITHRFVGTEPFDATTRQYNTAMKSLLEEENLDADTGPAITVIEIPRFTINGEIISASSVRALAQEKDFEKVARLVPKASLVFLEKKFQA